MRNGSEDGDSETADTNPTDSTQEEPTSTCISSEMNEIDLSSSSLNTEEDQDHVDCAEISDKLPDAPSPPTRKLRIAVAGCAHGEMDKIYAVLAEIEKEKGYKFDLLICCGDYQSVRNYGDLYHMHVNEKYRSLQTFYKYYSGEKEAPILTVFVGGNHEASGYLAELPNGGWVAPNIYYMGFANVIRFAGLRIAGLSGIYNGREFNRGHYERPPYTDHSEVVSSYHVRNIDVWRLKHLRPADDDCTSNPIDIVITHDWPAGIVDFGDKEALLRTKPFFRDDVESGKLGNPSTMQLLYDIRPRYWLSAHLHVGFAALVPHTSKDGAPCAEPTRFLALDKPIPRRHFIQAMELDVSSDAEMKLSYDPSWLAILRSTDSFTSISRTLRLTDENRTHRCPNSAERILRQTITIKQLRPTELWRMHANTFLPTTHCEERSDFRPTEAELDAIAKLGDLTIPENFRQTAPPLRKETPEARKVQSSPYYRNPQTAEFCAWLGISDMNKMLVEKDLDSVGIAHYLVEDSCADTSEIVIDDDIFADGEDFAIDTRPLPGTLDDFSPPPVVLKSSKSVNDADDLLLDFTPPKLTPRKAVSETEDVIVLKRRKVDLPDED